VKEKPAEEADAGVSEPALIDQHYWRLTKDAALADLSNLSILEAYGPDTTRFLQGMLTNDVAKLQAGEGCFAAFLTPIGKVIADLVALKLAEDRFWIILRRDLVEKAAQSLNRFIISDEVETRALPEWSAIGVLGPASRDRLANIIPKLPDKPLGSAALQVKGDQVRVIRNLRLGVDGYHLWVPADRRAHWTNLIQTTCGVDAVPDEVLEVIRIEAGVPEYGIDFDESNIPLESNLDSLIDFNKGCYIGQEIVARVTYLGNVSRKLVGLLFDDERVPQRGEEVRLDGQVVGRVTSAARSPALKRGIALAYVQRKALEYGKSVELSSGSRATIQKVPFLSNS